MFNLIDNTQIQVQSFQSGNATHELNATIDPFGNQSVTRHTQTNSGNFLTIITSMTFNTDITSRKLTFSVRVRNVLNVNSVILAIEPHNGFNIGVLRDVIYTNSWTLLTAETIATSVGQNLQVFLGVENAGAPPHVFESFGWTFTVDSLNAVYLEPEYNFKLNDKKIERKHRTPIGKKDVYKWGDYKSIELDVMYVSSGVREVVNSYWSTNAELLLVQSGQLEVKSVHITNKKIPINTFIQPYNNLSQGTIELETY